MKPDTFKVSYKVHTDSTERAQTDAKQMLHRSLLVGFDYDLLESHAVPKGESVDVELEFKLTHVPSNIPLNLAFQTFFPNALDLTPATVGTS